MKELKKTINILKLRTSEVITIVVQKRSSMVFIYFYILMCPKDADGMANNVDSDKTAPA